MQHTLSNWHIGAYIVANSSSLASDPFLLEAVTCIIYSTSNPVIQTAKVTVLLAMAHTAATAQIIKVPLYK